MSGLQMELAGDHQTEAPDDQVLAPDCAAPDDNESKALHTELAGYGDQGADRADEELAPAPADARAIRDVGRSVLAADTETVDQITARSGDSDGRQDAAGGDQLHTGDGDRGAGDAAGDGSGDDPPDGSGEAGEAGDDEEAALRQAYSRFGENMAALKTSITELEDPTTHPDYVGRTGDEAHPGSLVFRVADSADPSGEKNYITRFVPDGDEAMQAGERNRYEALLRARRINDAVVQADLEHIEAYGADEGQIVSRDMPGEKIDDLMPADKAQISDDNIRHALETIEAMVQQGIIPNRDYGSSVVIHPETHQLQFKDFARIEDTDADADHPILVTADSFMGVANRLYEPDARDDDTRHASDRFQESSQHALKAHYLYKRPYISYPAEALDEDVIKALYAHTSPARSSLTHDLHVASEMHELALHGQGRDLQGRRDALDAAREAYEMVVFQSVIDRKGDVHQVLREDAQGRNPLLINDHFLQARMALACWPASEARVSGEDLTHEQRQEINHNLAEVIREMMPGDEPPQASHKRETSYSGFLTEVLAMTALSRADPGVDTALALPTSEIRRLYGGPDGMFIFEDDDGSDASLDEDWKLASNGHPDTVNIGSVCYGLVSQLAEKPYQESDRRSQKVWASAVHVAKLLRDEGLNRRTLEPEEKTLLDQVQAEIWGVIEDKAEHQLGIDDLRGRARF